MTRSFQSRALSVACLTISAAGAGAGAGAAVVAALGGLLAFIGVEEGRPLEGALPLLLCRQLAVDLVVLGPGRWRYTAISVLECGASGGRRFTSVNQYFALFMSRARQVGQCMKGLNVRLYTS